MANFFTWLSNAFQALVAAALSVLPDSPFVYIAAIPEVQKYLGYFNYFIPVSAMVAIFLPWLSAITIYYAVSTILRWAKAIE